MMPDAGGACPFIAKLHFKSWWKSYGESYHKVNALNSIVWSLYDKDHMSELRIKNRSESDLRSCEVT